jgi:hypothetical protein
LNAEIGVSGCHPCRSKETQNRIIGLICPFLPPRVFVKCPSIRKIDGRGGGDRKQHRSESEGLGRNVGEHQGVKKEQLGIQRNPCWPLNGPSFLSVLRFCCGVTSRCSKNVVGFGPNFAARMASRQSVQMRVTCMGSAPRGRLLRDPTCGLRRADQWGTGNYLSAQPEGHS